ncbi:MAG: AbrB/MazE/SpoVT family DNA-binding domain-containing protein [Parcubacteria group bacterium]|nr:AbrB/MazE/SpoVT family DNA-binding domain-containing protein [Parcubacteria group bacterium]
MNKLARKKEEKVCEERVTPSEITMICPKCKLQCCSIVMKKKSDGKYWTDDTCFNCGTKLPIINIDRGLDKKGGKNEMDLVRLKSKSQLTIPYKICKELGIKKDDLFKVELVGKRAIFTPQVITNKF